MLFVCVHLPPTLPLMLVGKFGKMEATGKKKKWQMELLALTHTCTHARRGKAFQFFVPLCPARHIAHNTVKGKVLCWLKHRLTGVPLLLTELCFAAEKKKKKKTGRLLMQTNAESAPRLDY